MSKTFTNIVDSKLCDTVDNNLEAENSHSIIFRHKHNRVYGQVELNNV